MNQNKIFRNIVLFALVFALFTLSISIVSASCENSIIYYGTCTPSGNLEVDVSNGVGTNIISQSSCVSGLFATHIGVGGSGCTVKENDLISFKINGVDAGNQTWNGNFINYISLDGTPQVITTPSTPPANNPPQITTILNNNSNFKSGDTFVCSAHITDPDGDTVQGISSSLTSLANSSYSWASVNNMLSTQDCKLVNNSLSEIICNVDFNFALPVGGVECSFYSSDGKNSSQSPSSVNVVNSKPLLHSSISSYSGPVNTTISVVLSILDNDVDQIYNVQTNFQQGVLNIMSGMQSTFSWTPEENDTGNYTFGFTVSDGYDTSSIILPIEIISQGQPIPVPALPPPAPQSSGGGRRNYVKLNNSNGGGCYSYRDVEDRNLKCVGKAGQQVDIKQRAFCWGNFTGPSDSFNLYKYTCPLPPEPEKKEIISPAEQRTEPPQVSRLWLWVIIAIIIVVIILFSVYELHQRGVFDASSNNRFESNIGSSIGGPTRSPINNSYDVNKQPISKPNVSKPSEPPKVSAHVSVGEIESKINRANQLFDKGRIDEVKELIHEIASDYKIMNPEDRPEVYSEYMKLYEKIHSAQ